MSEERKALANFRKVIHDSCLKCEHRFEKECDLHDFFIKGNLCEHICDNFTGGS